MSGPLDWRCRACCQQANVLYTYPEVHNLYCVGCKQPMESQERLATILAALLPRLDALAQRGEVPAPTSTGQETDLLTVPEVARLLRVSPKAIRNRIDRGQIPVIKIGKSIRISHRKLLTSLSERRAPSSGGPRR